MLSPAVDENGIGAVTLPEPPVATLYHNRLVPVADSAVVISFSQYRTGLIAAGAAGIGLTVTVMAALGLSHPLMV